MKQLSLALAAGLGSVSVSGAVGPPAGVLLATLGSSQWTGAVDRDWTNAANWTNGVPDSTTSALIPDVANDPLVSDNLQVCDALQLDPGALLELDGSFAVHGGATIQGTVTGTGELRAEGAGIFTGGGTIGVKTVFNQDVTVQGGPLTIADDLDVRQDLTLDASSALVVSGTADLSPATTAVLSGSGTLDLDGAVVLQMSDGASVPRLEIAGDLSIDSSVFTPSVGTVRFDGSAAQTVTQLSAGATRFFDVEVGLAADVTVGGDLMVEGDLALDGEVSAGDDLEIGGDLQGGSMSNLAAGCNMVFGGNVEHMGGLSSSCMIVINEPSAASLVLDVSNPLPTDLDVQVGGRVELRSALTVQGDLRVVSGVLAAGTSAAVDVDSLVIEAGAALETEGFTVALPGAPPVTVRGELAVEPGGALELSASTVSIESGGKLLVVDATVRGLSGGGYALNVGAGATLAARGFVFQEMGTGGVVVHRDALLATKPLDLRRGTFTRPATNGVLLSLERPAATVLLYLRFENPLGVSPARNVKVAGASAPITLMHYAGGFAGPSFEDDQGARLEWGPAKLLFLPTSGSGSGGSVPLVGGNGGSSQVPGSAPPGDGGGGLDPVLLAEEGSTELALGPGVYAAFRVEGGLGRVARLVARGEARIDTRGGPVEVLGLEASEALELRGLELGGGTGPALLVAGARGAVRLEGCRIEGEVVLSAATTVLLDECVGRGLVLERGSRAQVRGGRFGRVELRGGSRLESFGLAPEARVAPGSRWIEHGERWPRLELVAGGTALFLDLPPGSLGWLAASGGLELSGARHGWALLPTGRIWSDPMPAREVRPLGPAAASHAGPRFFQALALDPARGTLTTSNLVLVF